MKKLLIGFLAFLIVNTSVFAAFDECLHNKNGEKVCKGDIQVVAGLNATVQEVDQDKATIVLAFDPADLTTFNDCAVIIPIDATHPHRNYDRRFRACGAKADELNFRRDDRSACVALCMHR